jgi:alpha,alpha-trehalose phosphorylase
MSTKEPSRAPDCPIASMGDTWMMLTYGFGGMQDDDGTWSFWPRRAPQEHAILRFPLTYRGQKLEVEIGPETVKTRCVRAHVS